MLKIARQPNYRWLADPVRTEGQSTADRAAWPICSANGWWSVFGKPRGRNSKKPTAGTPAFDDLVQRNFTAAEPNTLWLVDITEHWTGEAKLYCRATKDVSSNRVVDYSIDSRMKARLAVAALNNAATESYLSLLQKKRARPAALAHPEQPRIAIVTGTERTYHRRRRAGRSRPTDPYRIRNNHDLNRHQAA